MRKLFQQIREYLAVRPDPYAGGDLANAQRLGAVLWALMLALALVLLSLSPPDEAIGGVGWLAAGLLLAANAALVVSLRRQRLANWLTLLVVAYLALIGVASMQWLTGGVESPYGRLLLLPILFGAALHPPRRIAGVMLVALFALALPLAYDGWSAEAAGSAGAEFVIWFSLAGMVSLLMSGVRAQRLLHARDEAEAREEARMDSLTGLRNRRAFDEALDIEISRARRLRLPLSLAMVDIENFKEINDRWGHAEGDRCLREIAAVLRTSLRQPDLCFRWGGDEFSLILSGAAAGDTPSLGERLCAAIAESCERPDDEPIVARFAAAELDGHSPRELAARAGLALTEAKLRS